MNTFLTLEQVQAEHTKRGLPAPARTQLWRWVKDGRFPAPRKHGTRIYWVEQEIHDALDPNNLPRASYAPTNAEAL